MDLPREFSVPRWQVAANSLLGLVCIAISGFALRSGQANAFPGFLVGGLGFMGYGLYLATTRVDLTETELLIRTAFGKTSYRRSEVLAVDWEYGRHVSIDVTEQGWIPLPYLGAEPTELHVTLKYWIPIVAATE